MKEHLKYCKSTGLTILILILQIVFGNALMAQCDESLVDKAIEKNGKDALFIREFKIKQSDSDRKKKQKTASSAAKYDVRLNQGFVYRFNVENDQNSQSKALLQLRKDNLILASTYNIDKQIDDQSFDYYCEESGAYQVLMSFIEGNSGCAVGIVSAVIQDSTSVAAFADSTGLQNVLYAGVENYVDIAASNIRNGKLEVTIDRGTIKEQGGLYLILVDEPGTVTVDVVAKNSQNQVTETFKSEFKVVKPLLPTVSFGGSSGGIIKKVDIIATNPELILNNYRNDESFKINKFTITKNLSMDGSTVYASNRLNLRQLNMIKELKSGETFYIKDIEIENSKGQVYTLAPLGFIIGEE